MIVKKIVEKLRNKGYDDFYLANLANKFDVVFFVFFFFMAFIIMAFIAGFLLLLPDTVTEMLSKEEIHPAFGIFIFIIIILPFTLYGAIKDSKKKGETDLRITYIVSSGLSKFCLKLIRYAPIISVLFLIFFLILAIALFGFYGKMLIAFALSLLLLLILARPYHKLLAYVMKEAVYYVNWKTNQELEHFEELYSKHDKWWIPSADLDFEKFNIDRFRNISVTAFVNTFVGLFAGLFYVLSYSPMLRIFRCENVEMFQTEQLYEETSYDEAEKNNSGFVNAESDNVEKQEEVSTTNEDDVIEMEGENIIDENDAVKEVDEVEKIESAEEQDTRHYHLNELDEQPTMKDGGAFKNGIVDYLKERIPKIAEKRPYVEFVISPDGKIINVDASLVDDRELREEIVNSLLSMPNVIPGKKDGQKVYVITNISSICF